MKYKIHIELLEEYEKVNIYSFTIDKNKYTDYELFLKNYFSVAKYKRDFAVIQARIDKITEDGVFQRHFRYAGRCKDNAMELPSHIDKGKLRVYCLCISEKILILGNGGVKTTPTYNEDPVLNHHVEIIRAIDAKMKKLLKSKEMKIENKTISGKLTFDINC